MPTSELEALVATVDEAVTAIGVTIAAVEQLADGRGVPPAIAALVSVTACDALGDIELAQSLIVAIRQSLAALEEVARDRVRVVRLVPPQAPPATA